MAELIVSDHPTSVIVTNYKNIGLLPPKDGQMCFVEDKGMLSFDFNNKRTFYHSIELVDTEADRSALENPIDGKFYFIRNSGVLWAYTDGMWKQLTHDPKDVFYIGVDFPEVGNPQTLYVDKNKKEMYVWNDDSKEYEVVANYFTCSLADKSDITDLFV